MNLKGILVRLEKKGYRRPKGYHAPRTAAELISRYKKGERSFPETMISDESIETSFPGIDLRYSALRIIFSDVDLTEACFYGADLAFTHFDAKLVKANFENANLTWADFGRSNLTGSNLRGTDLRHTHFGYLLAPKERRDTDEDDTDDEEETPEWVLEAWEYLLRKEFKFQPKKPDWLDLPAMMRMVMTSPNVMRNRRPEWLAPFNFFPVSSDLRSRCWLSSWF